MTSEMELVVDAGGDVRCVYGEELDLRELGKLQITRASNVEPDAEGYWLADMGPVDGPVLGPFRSRTEALRAEREWINQKSILGHAVAVPPMRGTIPPPSQSES
jgi:hypothetical protein